MTTDPRVEAAAKAMRRKLGPIHMIDPMAEIRDREAAGAALAAADALDPTREQARTAVTANVIFGAESKAARKEIERLTARESALRSALAAAKTMRDAYDAQFSHHTLAGPTIAASLAFDRAVNDLTI